MVYHGRCRKVPLSEGRVEGGGLQCGYHGWVFGSDGRLTYIPQACLRRMPCMLHLAMPEVTAGRRSVHPFVLWFLRAGAESSALSCMPAVAQRG